MAQKASGKADSCTDNLDKSFTCDICGDVLSHKSHVTRHKRLKHPDSLDNECPSCDEVFATEHGLKIHHKRTHGTSLKYETKECEVCNTSFEYIPSQRPNAQYCSKNCANNGQVGEKAPNWNGGMIELSCDNCEKSFEVHEYESNRRFCNQECWGEWWSNQIAGEDNPSWNGGYGSYRGYNWETQREKALDRDNHTCQSCGNHESELENSLQVHHIIPYKKYESDERANRLENLVSLCVDNGCHQKWEGLYLRPDTR